MPDKISTFVETVAGEIRWKRARPLLTEEIETHLLDQRDDYIAEGLPPEFAEAEAVRQMGDPVKLGADLDRIHRPKPQWGLLAFTLVLALTGMLLRYDFGANLLTDSRVKDVLALFIGTGCLMLGYFLDISFLGRRAGLCSIGLVIGTGILCALCTRVNGRFWVAAYVTVLFPTALALLMWSQRGKRWRGVFLSLAGFGAAVMVSAHIPYLFSILTLTLTGLVLGLLFTNLDWFGVGRRLGMILTALLGLAVLALMVYGMRERILITIHPELDPLGAGYFFYAIREALNGAGWLGPAEQELSHWFGHSAGGGDLLLTNLICSCGFLPFFCLMAAFLCFFLWAFYRALKLKQTLGRAVSLSVLTTLLVQAGFSLLMNLGILPLFDAPFPLVVGNWNTLLDLFLIGLMLSAFRDGAMPEATVGRKAAHPRRISWRDGELVISFKTKSVNRG